MLIHAKKLINLPIIEAGTSMKLGLVSDIIVDSANGILLALMLKKRFFQKEEEVLSFRDVAEVYLDGIITSSRENIIDPKEVFRVNDVLNKNIFVLGSKVLTQNGKKIGVLDDFIFDTLTSLMMTLVVKKPFSSEKRIISSERILNILPGKIIIRDLPIKVSAPKRSKVLEPIMPV